MIKQITYIADDGTQFDDEWECHEYEVELHAKKHKNAILLFDKYGEPLPLTSGGMDNTHFLVIKTDEAAQFLRDTYDSIELPWEYDEESVSGAWYYDWRVDGWRTMDSYLKEAKLMEKILNL